MSETQQTRRDFIRSAAAGAVGIIAAGGITAAGEKKENKKPPLVLFSKHLPGMSPEEMAEFVDEAGLEGFDLAVRRRQAVNPTNVVTELPRAMKLWKQEELAVPMVSTETSLTNPSAPGVEKIWAACAKEGIKNIKVGYWPWRGRKNYWKLVEEAKKDIAGFAELSKKHGVKTLVHTHSGHYLTCNATSLMTLIRDFDPKHVGAYIDPAHLSINGEPLDMALNIVGEHLAMVAVKNARYMPYVKGGVTNWRRKLCMLNRGLVDWKEAIKQFKAVGYEGPFSMHGEYSGHVDKEEFKEKITKDVEFFKKAAGR